MKTSEIHWKEVTKLEIMNKEELYLKIMIFS